MLCKRVGHCHLVLHIFERPSASDFLVAVGLTEYSGSHFCTQYSSKWQEQPLFSLTFGHGIKKGFIFTKGYDDLIMPESYSLHDLTMQTNIACMIGSCRII